MNFYVVVGRSARFERMVKRTKKKKRDKIESFTCRRGVYGGEVLKENKDKGKCMK